MTIGSSHDSASFIPMESTQFNRIIINHADDNILHMHMNAYNALVGSPFNT